MLEIWGRLSSLNVRKVVWMAQEVGVPFERVDAGRQYGVVDTPEYRRMNPNGLVPTLVDADFRLWESNAIVRYLGAKYSFGGLYPEPLAARFDAERWMDWQQTTLNPAGRDAFVQLIRTAPEQRDAALIAQSAAAMEPLLALIDDHLSRRPFMAGESFTIADIPIGVEVHRWFGLPRQRPERPHIERWYKALRSRPATEGVLDLELE
ncbi:MAG TPA: glutathione S-transferase [Polyangiaceae bacterium]|nr:glutathione S-transferase [Polyangiaceae bacterium]